MGYGALLTGLTLLVAPLGGPREPPSGMRWDDFQEWTESGRWFWESVATGIGCVVVPLTIALLVMFLTREKKGKSIEPTTEPYGGSADASPPSVS